MCMNIDIEIEVNMLRIRVGQIYVADVSYLSFYLN